MVHCQQTMSVKFSQTLLLFDRKGLTMRRSPSAGTPGWSAGCRQPSKSATAQGTSQRQYLSQLQQLLQPSCEQSSQNQYLSVISLGSSSYGFEALPGRIHQGHKVAVAAHLSFSAPSRACHKEPAEKSHKIPTRAEA